MSNKARARPSWKNSNKRTKQKPKTRMDKVAEQWSMKAARELQEEIDREIVNEIIKAFQETNGTTEYSETV